MSELMKAFDKLKIKVQQPWFGKLIANPVRYLSVKFFNAVIYPITRKGRIVKVKLFFGSQIYIKLPAATDIFLTGGKSHDSELRLAGFMLRHLQEGDTYIDVGAHFGYFTLLAAHIVQEKGKIFAFEPSKENFEMLSKNCVELPWVKCYNQAISDKDGEVTFYQFPIKYSEYNSLSEEQYAKTDWLEKYRPEKITIPSVSMDSFLCLTGCKPSMIKIDVEGAEDLVIKGLSDWLSNEQNNSFVIMEYLQQYNKSSTHLRAYKRLVEAGFSTFVANNAGELMPVNDPDVWLATAELNSENFIFQR
jgi:FkbM family methyltransferase